MSEIEFHLLEPFEVPDSISDEDLPALIQFYEDMLRIRYMEEYLESEYSRGGIRGFCHLCIGQEGLYAVLKNLMLDDYLISSYRCHGAAYAAGIPPEEIICENLGTIKGNAKGKGGSMHLYSQRFFGGHGIVGAQVPLGAGLAFSIKYRSLQLINQKEVDKKEGDQRTFKKIVTESVCFCIYGDGASNQGQVYETFNLAKIYNLPIVFIVENNQFGMYTPAENVCVDDAFFKRGYSIPGIRLRDTKIWQLNRIMEYSRNYARSNGPIIVQIDTFRKCGHSTLDTTKFYMEKGTEENEKKLDCLFNLEIELGKKFTGSKLAEIKNRAKKSIEAVTKENTGAENKPGKSELYTDLFYECSK